jgi:hypothetical protein
VVRVSSEKKAEPSQQEHNLAELHKILDEKDVVVYPAGLDGPAYAPSKKNPVMRFGVAISKDAFEGHLSSLDQWHMAIVFFRQPYPEKKGVP